MITVREELLVRGLSPQPHKIVEGYGPRPHAEGEEYRRILRASMTGYPGNRGNTAAQL